MGKIYPEIARSQKSHAAVGPVAAEALGRRVIAAPIMPTGRYFIKPLVAAILAATARP